MSEWLTFVKAYAAKNNIPFKQALTAAFPSYKTRNESPPEQITESKEEVKKRNENMFKNLSKKINELF